MRFLILQRCADETSAPWDEDMHRYARALTGAGILLAGGRLMPGSGVRVSMTNGRRAIGSRRAAPGEIAAFWIIEARSADEAAEWARRAPLTDGLTLDVVPIREPATPEPTRNPSS